MLIIDFEATRARIKDRCVAARRVAAKYDLNKNSFTKFCRGEYLGASGQGEYGRFEKALIDEGLLVFGIGPDQTKEKRI